MNRYSKQSILPEIGTQGQKLIEGASVLCVGAGGLASSVLPYLAGAGVGRIGIVDADRVEVSNLQRQILFQENQVGILKVEAARSNLEKLNSSIQIEIYPEMLNASNVQKIFDRYDLVVDATDNFSTKYLINDAAVKFKKPAVFASVTGLEGQVLTYDAQGGACFRCVYPETTAAIPNCEEAGVLGPVVGMMGSIQATECLKFLFSKTAMDSLLSIDARDFSIFKTKIHQNTACPVCFAEKDKIVFHSEVDDILRNPGDYLLIDVREKNEWENSRLPGAVHLPISQIRKDATALKDLDLNRKWVTYCVTGQRAREAVRIFADHGFQATVLQQ